MRLNKLVISNFKIKYDESLSYLKICLLVLAALSVIFNFYLAPALGVKALLIFIVAYVTSIATEAAYYMFSKNHSYQKALISVEESFPEISGLIFALLLPIGAPLFAVIMSLVMAIIIAKMAFGGYSYNIFNVAVVGAVIFYVSWPAYSIAHLSTSNWVDITLLYFSNDTFGGMFATPVVASFENLLNANVLYEGYLFFTTNTQAYLGFLPAVVIIPVGLFLVYKKVVDPIIPLSISVFTIVGSFIIGTTIKDYSFTDAIVYGLHSLFSTIMIFIAFFVASEPITSPSSRNTKIIYSLIIVLVTLYIREISTNVEGVLYAILFANMFTPLLRSKSGTFSIVKKAVAGIILLAMFIGGSYFIASNRNAEAGKYEMYIQNSGSAEAAPDASSSATK